MPLPPVPIPRRFEGRSVVVTGAGTGFGAEIAVRAAQEGARVVGVHYRSSAAGAERPPNGSAPRAPRRCCCRPTSSSGRRSRRWPTTRSTKLGGVDVLVNNVGDVAREQMSWRDITEESIDHVLAVDIKGTMACIHEFGQRMLDAGPRQHRQHRLDRHRARQRPGAAVRRREVRPARRHEVLRPRVRPDRTGQHLRARLHRDRGDARPRGLEVRPRRPAARADADGPHPGPGRVAGAALFLATDDASHITGTYMVADGGYNMVGA